ncbi:MAG: hypothetical protein ACKOW9_05365 [Candidatus Paceibacterota bacterium]
MIKCFSRFRRCNRNLHVGKSYTTLEVVIGASLSALLVAAIIAWAGGIGRVVSNEVNVSDNGRTELAFMRMQDDILALTHCNVDALDSPIRSMSENRIDFVSSSSGEIKLVSWKFEDGILARGEEVMPADCAAPSISTWSSMVTEVDMSLSGFYPVRDGVRSSSPSDYISCEDRFLSSCFLDSVYVELYRSKNNELRSASFNIDQ